MFESLKRWLQPAKPAKPEASTPNGTAPAAQRPASVGSPGTLVIDMRSERELRATATGLEVGSGRLQAAGIPIGDMGVVQLLVRL